MMEQRPWLPVIDPKRKCRVCGCRDNETCDGGCYWTTRPVEDDPICSKCVDLHDPQEPERG